MPAAKRLATLGASKDLSLQLHGAELHAPSAVATSRILEDAGYISEIHGGDFFDFPPFASYDAVVGNPPYVRYQEFAGAARVRGQTAALAAGVSLSGLASSWAPFVVHASRHLKPDGRLGLVVPAELLSVNYAAPVRRFLMERFASVRLVMFEARVFPGALEEVVLLLAEGCGPTDHISLTQVHDLSDLSEPQVVEWVPGDPARKWTPALLAGESLLSYADVAGRFVELKSWGRTDLGMVTGNNKFFTLTEEDRVQLRLRDSDLHPISPPGSKHLRGLTFDSRLWSTLASEGQRVYLWRPPMGPLTRESAAFEAAGLKREVDSAYKCRVRTPWWRVPWVAPPDLFLTYMNHDTPRLVANEAGVSYVNSVHGVTLREELRDLGQRMLPIAALNSLTLLGAELVGRSYGGGLLKVEPCEAALLPVPSREIVGQVEAGLEELRPNISLLLARGDLVDAVRLVDQVLLVDGLGIPDQQVHALQAGRASLFGRRVARGGN